MHSEKSINVDHNIAPEDLESIKVESYALEQYTLTYVNRSNGEDDWDYLMFKPTIDLRSSVATNLPSYGPFARRSNAMFGTLWQLITPQPDWLSIESLNKTKMKGLILDTSHMYRYNLFTKLYWGRPFVGEPLQEDTMLQHELFLKHITELLSMLTGSQLSEMNALRSPIMQAITGKGEILLKTFVDIDGEKKLLTVMDKLEELKRMRDLESIKARKEQEKKWLKKTWSVTWEWVQQRLYLR